MYAALSSLGLDYFAMMLTTASAMSASASITADATRLKIDPTIVEMPATGFTVGTIMIPAGERAPSTTQILDQNLRSG